MNRLLSVLLFVSVLSVTEALGQIEGRIVKPRSKPPTITTTTTTKPKPPKKPTTTKPSLTSEQRTLFNELASDMVYVEGGTFTMGATSEQGSDAYNDEKPAHQVTLSSFHICKYEVTQELWQAVMGSNPSKSKGIKRPVEQVSWEDCQVFISKLNQLTGKNYRLPTEAEWEYAARGGNRSNGYKYAGGNSIGDVAWYEGNCILSTNDIGMKRANELGLYDMAGNVWEWCSDWKGNYSTSNQTNPRGASSGSYRVRRGGFWSSDAKFCRVSFRIGSPPDYRFEGLGLRLAF